MMHASRQAPADEEFLVEVEDLCISFHGRAGIETVVSNVSFAMRREKLAIVGESGSGKSMTARAIMGLLPAGAKVTAKKLSLGGLDLRNFRERDFAPLRGRRMAMILQDPKQSLNPIMTAGAQIMESCRLHLGDSKRQARERTLELLRSVRIVDPMRVFELYPFELSGGMGQRIMIAMMLAAEPDLLIADEPTSALDVSVRGEILDLIQAIIDERGMGLILISHDLDLVASYTDRVVVMYAGRIKETLPAFALRDAKHPYTRGLLACRPPVDRRVEVLPVLERDPKWLS
jgi:peptide/nickel transport system ATP-binding protein